ncbi:hypothetical protein HY008_01590 [Candidatus Woesebacteria bacterium]|nr:hypothetical protein [Candidatus Woesebacteria bacterium]
MAIFHFPSSDHFSQRKYLRYLLFIGVSIIVIIVLSNIFKSSRDELDNRVQIEGAKEVESLNREFNFPLKDNKGTEVSKIKIFIERAELRDQIIVKGQKATAVRGRIFLILTLKVTNEYSKPVEIETRDYIRLSVNGNENEWLVPDIHNDPVEVRGASTKITRVGFPINDTDRNLLLQVGEIGGYKQKIELSLNK